MTVITFGVWDLLHIGHVAFLGRAAALGTLLIVGVPTDEVVFQDKGELPVVPCLQRLTMVAALRCVDLAEPYYELDFIALLEMHNPNVLAVGEQWGSAKRHKDAEAWMAAHDGKVRVVPHTIGVSTTDIKRLIKEQR